MARITWDFASILSVTATLVTMYERKVCEKKGGLYREKWEGITKNRERRERRGYTYKEIKIRG